jgi:hypothetical protein
LQTNLYRDRGEVNLALTCGKNLPGWLTFCGIYLPAAGRPATTGKPATAGKRKLGGFSVFLFVRRDTATAMSDKIPTVVIVGGGFAGLSAAKALRNAPVRTILIDRSNHHLFQPLLYQVATSVLSPAQIASPLREVLARQRNTIVLLGEVTGVDKEKKLVFASGVDRAGVPLSYD